MAPWPWKIYIGISLILAGFIILIANLATTDWFEMNDNREIQNKFFGITALGFALIILGSIALIKQRIENSKNKGNYSQT